MKKFVFKLEDVLSIREFQQEQAEIELGKALEEERKIQEKLDAVAVQHAACVRQIDGTLDFSAIASAQQYFAMLEVQKNFLLEELTRAKLVTEQKRKILQEKMKKSASLSKLREKELVKFQKQVLDEEELAVDDVASSRYKR